MLQLTMLLTELDRAQSQRKDWNPYALPQYLKAAEGVTDAKSFADAFNATRGMHLIAKRLGFALDVERGEWVET